MIKNENFNKWINKMNSIYHETFEVKTTIANLLKKAKIDPDSKEFKAAGGDAEGVSGELVR